MIPETKIGSAFAKMLINGGLMFIVATLLFPSEIPGRKTKDDEIDYRLPNHIIPLHYFIHLMPIIEYTEQSFSYIGSCRITLFILYSTWNITFHLDYIIQIQDAEIHDYFTGSFNESHLPLFSYDVAKNTIIFYFVHEMSPGIYNLRIKYTGVGNDNNHVFFRTPYKNKENFTELMTLTNFQRIGARQVFPCWDEPAMKATFMISVTYYPEYASCSNMPIEWTEKVEKEDNEWTIDNFYTTLPISPYRIGILLYTENGFRDNIINNVTVHYRRNRKTIMKDLTFAKMIIKNVTTYLKSKWKIIEMIPKMDHAIIPGLIDNSIQNWGLVCYNEADVIYNHTLDSAGRDREVAYLVARQVASQWFSNLVSPSWWSDEWLNEGLTMLLGMDAIDKLFPDHQIMDLFIVQNRDLLNLDLHMKNKPFMAKINSPTDINSLSLFPYYLKASAFLRTLQHVVTKQIFEDGVHIYFNTHKFSSATSDDFWNAMQTALKKTHHAHKFNFRENLLKCMWHYTCITVEVNRDYDTGSTAVSIKYDILNCDFHIDIENIRIPVTYTTQNNINFNITSSTNIMWVNKYEKEYQSSLPLTFHSNDTDGWLILNLQQIGYYRVNYDVTNWQRIVEYLNTKDYTKIHVLNRAQLIDDMFHLVQTSKLCLFLTCAETHDYAATLFLKLLNYLSQETNFVAWYPMFKAFEYLSCAFPFPEMANVKEEMRKTLNSVIEMIGYDDPIQEDLSNNSFYNSNIILRHEILRWACVLNVTTCQAEAIKKLLLQVLNMKFANQSWSDLSWSVPGLKEWTICNAITIAENNTWSLILNTWQHISDNKLLEFLACTKNSTITKQYLDMLTSETYFTAKDRIHSFYFIVAKRVNDNAVLDYIEKNFEKIIPKEVGTIAALIFIINHLYNLDQLFMLNVFVQNNLRHLISSSVVYDKIFKRIICIYQLKRKLVEANLIKWSNN
ncbi:glutamyl aminopeptidase-like isoform X1 [Linepithema humile]|uniref:glutamyl aminopeptidase-like isoform X1 n=1 Tax=Linepithema humile TaxID=83485 RepID=UPI00351E9795